MRKLISVLLAVATIVCTTSSLAASSTGTLASDSRNDITAMAGQETGALPAFRVGDTIKFDVSALTNEKILTVISYKYNKPEDLSDETIQYVNQYTVSADTQTIDYEVRDNTEEGIYKLSFSGNETTDGTGIVDFYYKVGNPKVVMVPNDGLNYWNMETHQSGGKTYYAVGYVAKAFLGSNEVSYDELGVANLGFKFTVNGVERTHTLTEEQFKAIETAQGYSETDGKISFVYGVTVYGIDTVENANAIVADAVLQDK